MNWPGHDGLHFMQNKLMKSEKHKSNAGFFNILNAIFKLQDNKTLSLQYCKLSKEENENAEEWMGHLTIKGNEWNYKKHDRQLKGQL